MTTGRRRAALVVGLAALGGCRCGADRPVTAGGAEPQPHAGSAAPVVRAPVVRAPLPPAQARQVLDCLLDRAGPPRALFDVLVDDAPLATVQLAADEAVARARRDGESPAATVLKDALDVFTTIDEPTAIAATLAQIDALSVAQATMLFGHVAPQRARVGLPIAEADIAGDVAAIVRERAIAGDVAGAIAFWSAHAKADAAQDRESRAGALAATGKPDAVKRLIAGAPADERGRLAGAWLETALRMKASIADPLAAVISEVEVASDRALLGFDERALFHRAARLGRGAELAPLYRALKARYATAVTAAARRLEILHDLATAIGEPAELAALRAAPELATTVAVRVGPLPGALALARAEKYPVDDLVRLWARAVTGAEPGFGDALVAAACPPPVPPPAPATPAQPGLRLAVTERARGMRQECALHDVVVRLVDGKTRVAEETLDGECTGACTAAAQREGQASVARIEEAIARGEASDSELDYNFTDCTFTGPEPGRIDRVGGRDVALILDHYNGPHDVPGIRYQLALEVCGQLHITPAFGARYVGSWEPAELAIRETPDHQQIVVEGSSERWRGVVFRLTLPACPGTPVEHELESE